MLGGAASSQAAAEGMDEERPFVLEAHSYSGGLRVQLLGHDPNRPAWVPPHDYVGFRNEIALAAGDYVVEFARFGYRGRRVTWIGLFEPAVDEVFGDRLNHAGVGVWLLERDILHPDTLLHGLKRLADALVQESGELLRDNAEAFLGGDYLPAYVVPSRDLPARLGGWAFVAGPLPETVLFAAVDGDRERAWSLAAEQLLRVSILRGPSDAHGRALILVRTATVVGDGGLEPVRDNLGAEIVRALPAAIRELLDESAAARNQAEQQSARCGELESALESERARNSELADRVPALEAEADTLRVQLEGNDTYQAWSSLKQEILDVSRQVGRTENAIENARQDIVARIRALQSGPEAPERRRSPSVDHHDFVREAKRKDRSERRGGMLMWSLIGVVALLLLAVAGYVGWTQWPADPEAEVRAIDDVAGGFDR